MREETKPSNPFAFPVTDNTTFVNDGMTLRDYFANSAMQGAMIGDDYKHVKTAEQTAQWAYTIADAMLKQREQ